MGRTRLTRRQMQAKTRRLLMEAAGKVCSKHGLQQASIDEVAETAGFTKGAFYANFKNKEELFLSMLDERFAQRLKELDELGRDEGEPVSVARQAGLDIAQVQPFDNPDPRAQQRMMRFRSVFAKSADR